MADSGIGSVNATVSTFEDIAAALYGNIANLINTLQCAGNKLGHLFGSHAHLPFYRCNLLW